jgi:prepilin-type N-terminal cleavage/methylation domain-containing protein/prepilin-type processing-associated H-X9-DG protein
MFIRIDELPRIWYTMVLEFGRPVVERPADSLMSSRFVQALQVETRRVAVRVVGAFTLVELLITIAILAILISLLLPAARNAVGAARGFKCQMSQRSVTFDFGLFADESLHPYRGDDDSPPNPAMPIVPKGQFRLETFIESQYGLDEFWADTYGNAPTAKLPDGNGRDPMRCAEVKGDITLARGVPCTQGAVSPPKAISYGFNERLRKSESMTLAGNPNPVGLSRSRLERQGVGMDRIPLLWDVDGAVAAQRNLVPLFSAPAMGSTTLYAGDQHWFPAQRHNGTMSVSFIDGHVTMTRKPLMEAWAWDFDPAK